MLIISRQCYQPPEEDLNSRNHESYYEVHQVRHYFELLKVKILHLVFQGLSYISSLWAKSTSIRETAGSHITWKQLFTAFSSYSFSHFKAVSLFLLPCQHIKKQTNKNKSKNKQQQQKTPFFLLEGSYPCLISCTYIFLLGAVLSHTLDTDLKTFQKTLTLFLSLFQQKFQLKFCLGIFH